MKEKRHRRRRHLAYYLMVFDRDADELMGYLVDITPIGIQLISSEAVPVGRDFQLRLIFPAKLAGNRQLDVDARSVWCREDIKPGYAHSGFELVEPDQSKVDIIELLVDEFGSRD